MGKKIVDVARLAGVSPATVSLVYSNSPRVAAKTRAKVMKAGKRSGYFPNAAARAVRRGRFYRIAAVVVQYGPRGTTYVPNNGYFDTAADKLADEGYSLVFEPMHLQWYTDDFIEPPRLFMELAVDGILALPATGYVPPKLDEQLEKLGAPVVWLNRKSGDGFESVYCDEVAGGRLLAKHLIDLGHRRIGYLGFKGLHYSVEDRLEGVRSAMVEAGLDLSGLQLAVREASMVPEAERLLEADPPFTAAVCYQRRGHDAMLHMCSQRGIRVPFDLSIAHFASVWEREYLNFPTTRLEVPEPKMAEVGVELLLRKIQGRDTTDIPRAVVGKLCLGMTTGRPG